MIKKINILLVVLLLPIIAVAQVAVGGWKLYSPFMGVESMAETKAYVYYISAGALYRVDKQTTEVQSLNTNGDVNDTNATAVYVDLDGKSVITTYSSGNMDRLYDNGKIKNISDIKDAQNVNSYSINNISFTKDKFYVASDFGLVTYNGAKNEVMETMFTQTPVQCVAANEYFVAVNTDNKVYVAPAGQRIKKFADLKEIPWDFTNANSIKAFGDKYLYFTHYNSFTNVEFDLENPTNYSINAYYTIDGVANQQLFDLYTSNIYRIDNNTGYIYNSTGFYKFEAGGNVSKVQGIEPATDTYYMYTGDASDVWVGSAKGVCEMDFSKSTPVEITGNITGSDLAIKQILYMTVGADGRLLMNLYFPFTTAATGRKDYPSRVIMFKDGKFKDVSGSDLQMDNNRYKLEPPYKLFFPFKTTIDPSDPDAYYVGTFFEGIYRIKDGKQTNKYYATNSGFPMIESYGCMVEQCTFDKYGNLWTYVLHDGNQDVNRIFALPANKHDKVDVTPSDWVVFKTPEITKYDTQLSSVVSCPISDRMIVLQGTHSLKMAVIDHKGTPSPSDDKIISVVDRYVDQDGKEWRSDGLYCGIEDKDGKVWVGTNVGLFEIPNVAGVTGNTATIRRMKVPRNDGTNLADYLLDNVEITMIAVDASNRKWISTNGAGVYLVSPEGDAILEHYTIDNSILPSNVVYAVACDPTSNKVYFGTPSGLVEYNSTSAPGAENYDDVYAFPNPVRPEYGGWITVTGLMDNSLVKIADAYGNVINQGKSDGGMYVWDGCNTSGSRVKTGVYYVLASQNATGQSEACVTKIMVVN